MKICNRKELLKLTFRGLALRQGEMFRSAKSKTKSSVILLIDEAPQSLKKITPLNSVVEKTHFQ